MSMKKIEAVESDLGSLFKENSVESLAKLKNASLCVLGGCGFMGLWIAEIVNYLNEKHKFNTQLFLIDRNTTNFTIQAPHLLNKDLIKVLPMDVRNIFELPKETNYIIQMASSPNSNEHVTNPIDTMSSIALGTEKVLMAAERLSDLKMIALMSSGLVYGKPSESVKLKETDAFSTSFSSVSQSYIEAKRYSEVLASSFRQHRRLPVVTLRPFSFTGPYQPAGSPWALNNFINDILKGNAIRILGDGKAVRSYLYASDAAYWILKSLLFSNSGEVFNLGSSNPVQLVDLAKLVQQLSNKSVEIVLCQSQNTPKVDYLVPDTSLIQKRFELKETVSLEKAIKNTLNWHQIG